METYSEKLKEEETNIKASISHPKNQVLFLKLIKHSDDVYNAPYWFCLRLSRYQI